MSEDWRYGFGRDGEGITVHVSKANNGTHPGGRGGRRCEGERRDNDFVTMTQTKRHAGEFQRMRAGGREENVAMPRYLSQGF